MWRTVAWLCLACGSTEVSEVLVRIDAQPASAARASAVRARVITTDGTIVELDDVSIDELPVILPLVPAGGDPSRTWIVEASLLDSSRTEFAWARLRGGYVRGEIREALICFDDLCSDRPCDACGVPDGGAGLCTTCVDRACAPAAEAMLMERGTSARCPEVMCVATAATEIACDESDAADDDCDGDYNCADADCDGSSCGANGRMCEAGACACPLGAGEDTIALCHDGVDNDCDGRTDCADDDPCRTFPEDCGTADDDDCDGLTGCADPDCGMPENCDTPEDEDCDGETACDSDCTGPELDPTACHNGIDDDCNGYADCADESCCLNGNCNGHIIESREAGPGIRCCSETPINVYANESHCASCGVACDPGFMCVRVGPTAACRCTRGDNSTCPAGFICRDLEGQVTCDCDSDADCGGAVPICATRGGAMFHNVCGPLS